MKRPLVQNFTTTIRTLTGHKIKGEFGDPNRHPRPRKEIQNLPHRTLIVPRRSPVAAGDIVIHEGIKMILIDQHSLSDLKRFLAVDCNAEFPWSRSGTTTDPVTKMKRSGIPELIEESIPVVIEPMRWLTEQRFEHDILRVLSGHDLQDEDILGPYKVLRRTELFGATMAEVTKLS